jgi:hypothetical protein
VVYEVIGKMPRELGGIERATGHWR